MSLLWHLQHNLPYTSMNTVENFRSIYTSLNTRLTFKDQLMNFTMIPFVGTKGGTDSSLTLSSDMTLAKKHAMNVSLV